MLFDGFEANNLKKRTEEAEDESKVLKLEWDILIGHQQRQQANMNIFPRGKQSVLAVFWGGARLCPPTPGFMGGLPPPPAPHTASICLAPSNLPINQISYGDPGCRKAGQQMCVVWGGGSA